MTLFYIEQHGDAFQVRLRTDVPLNAWEGGVVLPADIAAHGVIYGTSIGDIWQTPPTLSGSSITFAGGASSGFVGDGLLFQFNTTPANAAKGIPAAELIAFDPRTIAYAADGKGTPAKVVLQPVTVNAHLVAATSSGPQIAITPPDPFKITLVREPGIFQGRLAAVFAATDADAGIDHYEVQERTANGVIGWHAAVSPYLIDPDTSSVSVKAVDRTGAARIESATIRYSAHASISTLAGYAILIVVVGIVTLLVLRKWLQSRFRWS